MCLFFPQSSLLSLLSYPLTGHLAASSNSTVFALHTEVWQKGMQKMRYHLISRMKCCSFYLCTTTHQNVTMCH